MRNLMDEASELRLAVLQRAYGNKLQPPPVVIGESSGLDIVKISQTPPRSPEVQPSHIRPQGWSLKRVTSGHYGYIHDIKVDPGNQWFATASADHTIKAWDLASGQLKLTLTGHVLAVRALAISSHHPYLFSGGDDKALKCWDLETNKVIRDYHGHLSGVYSVAVHPALNLVVSAGRDAAVRVWDIRTRHPVHVMAGHKGPINTVTCQDIDPQVLSGSQDRTIRLWDLRMGNSEHTLTHHSNSVRSVVVHDHELTFASGGRDAIKQYKLPEGTLIGDMAPNLKTNCLALSGNVVASGGDDGRITLIDWATGTPLGELHAPLMPGSIESEQGILCCAYDWSGSRLLTGDMERTVKVWAKK